MNKVSGNLRAVQTSFTDWSRESFKDYQWRIKKLQAQWEKEMASGGGDIEKLKMLDADLNGLLEEEDIFCKQILRIQLL